MGYKCRIFDRVLVYFSIWEPLLQYHKRAIGSLYKGQEKVLKIRTKHQNQIKASKPHSPGSIARSWPGSPETAATPRGIRDSWTPPQCPASNPQTHPDRGQAAPRKDPGKQKENLKKMEIFPNMRSAADGINNFIFSFRANERANFFKSFIEVENRLRFKNVVQNENKNSGIFVWACVCDVWLPDGAGLGGGCWPGEERLRGVELLLLCCTARTLYCYICTNAVHLGLVPFG